MRYALAAIALANFIGTLLLGRKEFNNSKQGSHETGNGNYARNDALDCTNHLLRFIGLILFMIYIWLLRL